MHATSHVKSAPCAHRSRIDVAVNLDVASGHHRERVFDVAFDRKTALHSKIAGMNIDRSLMHVVIHDIEGTMAGAISVFKNSANQTSAHYIVRSHDGHIVKMVLEHNNAWHAGHGWFNRHSIGIEHEGFAHKKNGGGYYTDTLYGASAALTCSIAHRYNIPIDRKHIFGHENVPSSLSSHTLCSDARGVAGLCGGVSHHSDPGKYWGWKKYMKLVSTCVAAAH